MSQARTVRTKLNWRSALLVAALPMACAVGVEPVEGNHNDLGDTGGSADTAGSSSGGMVDDAGTSSLPKSGTTSTGGKPTGNPFGGTSSSGGTASSGGSASSGGKASGGSGSGGAGKGGSGGGGKAGSSSGGTGTGGSSAAGTGAGGSDTGCGCAKTLTWTDNTNISWSTGDCLTVSGKTYLYTGTKAQTYANVQCNPTKQETWCTDSGNDYKFMLCP